MERDIGRGAEVLSAKSSGSNKCCAMYPEYGTCFMLRIYSLIFRWPTDFCCFPLDLSVCMSSTLDPTCSALSGFYLHISNFLYT